MLAAFVHLGAVIAPLAGSIVAPSWFVPKLQVTPLSMVLPSCVKAAVMAFVSLQAIKNGASVIPDTPVRMSCPVTVMTGSAGVSSAARATPEIPMLIETSNATTRSSQIDFCNIFFILKPLCS